VTERLSFPGLNVATSVCVLCVSQPPDGQQTIDFADIPRIAHKAAQAPGRGKAEREVKGSLAWPRLTLASWGQCLGTTVTLELLLRRFLRAFLCTTICFIILSSCYLYEKGVACLMGYSNFDFPFRRITRGGELRCHNSVSFASM
jgi:hypothetical protein